MAAEEEENYPEAKVYFNRSPWFVIGPLHGLEIDSVVDSRYGLLKVTRLNRTPGGTDGAYDAVLLEVWEKENGL